MKKVIMGMVGGLLLSIMLCFLRYRGVKIDSKEIEKIKKNIRSKPIADVVKSLNGWLS